MVESKKRTYYLDILRILACIFVVINHSEAHVFKSIDISLTWCISMFKFLLCKVAVPIFFMISGALLLKKEESYVKTFWRIARMIVILFICSVILPYVVKLKIPSLKDLVHSTISAIRKPYFTAYWYLYATIALYIMTPILRKLVKNMSDKDFKYYFVVWFLYTGLLPMISQFINIEITGYFNLSLFNVYIGYYILGYYINNLESKSIEKIKIWQYLCLIFIPIIINFILTFISTKMDGKTSLILDGYNYITVMISSIGIFGIARKMFENRKIANDLVSSSITEIGKCTFGIYLIHIFLLDRTYNLIYANFLNLGINFEIAAFTWQLIVIVIALVLVYIIRRIPLVNKLI